MALSLPQLVTVARYVGFPAQVVPYMAAIGMAESTGNPKAHNPGNPPGKENSWGLWQINVKAHGTRFGTVAQLQDPYNNARAALTLYRERQQEHPNGLTVLGKRYTGLAVGLTHWGAFTDGRYKKHFAAAQQAATGAPVTVPPGETAGGAGASPGTPPGAPRPQKNNDLAGYVLIGAAAYLLLT